MKALAYISYWIGELFYLLEDISGWFAEKLIDLSIWFDKSVWESIMEDDEDEHIGI